MLKRSLLFVFSAGLITACSSTTKHHYPVAARPSEEIQKVEAEIQESRRQQYDVMAPKSFANAEEALDDAKKDLEKNRDRDRILSKVEVARMNITVNHTRGEQVKKQLSDIAKAREIALSSGVAQSSPGEFKAIEKDLTDETEDIEKDSRRQIDPKMRDRLQAGYLNMELRGIVKRELGPAEEYIRQARDEGASRWAPGTLESATTRYRSAMRAIEGSRHNPGAYREQVNAANAEAKKLFAVTLSAKNSRSMSPEAIALEIQNRENKFLQEQQRLQALQSETDVRNRTMDSQSSRASALMADNESMQKELEWNEKIAAIGSRFDPDEAEVYRQGDKVVLRLKSVQFPTARADIPENSLSTLAKVTDIIEEVHPEKVTVEGHTDSVGGRVENMRLSQRRASTVSRFLTSQNVVSADQVEAKGYGFDKPITSDKTPEGRAQNRRVDIVLTTDLTASDEAAGSSAE